MPTTEETAAIAALKNEYLDIKRRQLDAARLQAVKEMMLNPKRLEFGRWLITTGRITDYGC